MCAVIIEWPCDGKFQSCDADNLFSLVCTLKGPAIINDEYKFANLRRDLIYENYVCFNILIGLCCWKILLLVQKGLLCQNGQIVNDNKCLDLYITPNCLPKFWFFFLFCFSKRNVYPVNVVIFIFFLFYVVYKYGFFFSIK